MIDERAERRKAFINQMILGVLIFLAVALVSIILLALIGPSIGNIYSSDLLGL